MTALELRNSVVGDIDLLMSDERLMRRLASYVNGLCEEFRSTHHKIIKHSPLTEDNMTDEQWHDYFKGKDSVEPFESNFNVEETVKAFNGRTVKPMEKWL